jgi:hypothetical protein
MPLRWADAGKAGEVSVAAKSSIRPYICLSHQAKEIYHHDAAEETMHASTEISTRQGSERRGGGMRCFHLPD